MGCSSTKLYFNNTEFAKFKETFLNAPQTYTNNALATYKPELKQKSDQLSSGDIIKIDIIGPLNNSHVKVTNISSTASSFSMSFATLEDHAEAGIITFSGSINGKGEISFNITNTSRIGQGDEALVAPLTRFAQRKQWEMVLDNTVRKLNKVNGEISKTEEITRFQPNKDGQPNLNKQTYHSMSNLESVQSQDEKGAREIKKLDNEMKYGPKY